MGTFPAIDKVIFFLKFCGLWPAKNKSKYLSVLYQFYSIVIIVIFLAIYDLFFCVYIFLVEDWDKATEHLCMNLALIVLFGRLLNLKFFFRQIKSVLRISEEFILESGEEILLVNQKISFFSKIAIFNCVGVNAGCMFAYISTIFADEIQLPFHAWYPIDWKSNPMIYVLLYLYQFFGMTIQSNLSVCVDILTAYPMFMCSVQLEILGRRLEKLNEMKCQSNEDIQIDAFIKCVVTYQRIKK